MQASIKTMIKVTTPDKPGMMANVFSDISGAGINVAAFTAWVQDGKGEFRIFADDSKSLISVLSKAGHNPQTQEVIVIKAENKAGAAWAIGKKLGDAGVNIRRAFATSGSGGEGMVVVLTDDNEKALQALKS